MSARIGLGLAALGRPGYLNLGHGADLGADRSVAALRARSHAVLDAAYAAGVRDFDAARSYGRAEEFLGEWLRSRDPAGVRISSKWGYVYTAGWEVAADPPEVKHHDADTFRRQLAESRELLGDRLDLYQIHSATPDSGVLENDAVLSAMVEAGVPLGVSVSGVSQEETLDRARELGIFSAVQATWNLHERSAEPALERAAAAGLTVYVKEGLANGRLATVGRAPALDAAAAELGTTPDALALAAILTRPWAGVVLSGAATIDTLGSNLRALEVGEVPDLAELREDGGEYWARRSALPWN
ncbi:aldo/keto reductase [Candidatus Solirubrobacter pratensis]|uniref:aldo/keto reductase n=1 Tax=Candidatus Solirubrobacter pratensis TaxID=1298857 RepID=UPI0003FD4A0B|nr:aldo/keto reductase [Candidatus Solirubrobacter pratensis]